MIASSAFRGRRYAVLGLARSGAATVRALLASGAQVTAWDADEAKRAEMQAPSLQGRGRGGAFQRELAPADRPHPPAPSPNGEGELSFADPLSIDLAGYDGVVVSPGVPLNTHPIAEKARTAQVPVIGDIELFAQARADLPPHKVVGITGTNGKSTTTALIHHILVTAGIPATLGGNIGLPILGQDPLPAGGVYVIELSSYQIDLTQSLDCDVAILLNITPDHLDRYDGFAAYAASKARLFAMMRGGGAAIIGAGDEASRAIAASLHAPRRRELNCVFELVRITGEEPLDQSAWAALQGPHNAQNAAAAIAAARALGLDEAAIAAGLHSYPGLPHRMERVAEKAGVLYVNDSKATNATSTAPALAAFPPGADRAARIRWILGGRAKSDDLDACAPFFGNVRAAYTIGEAGPTFARLLRPHMPVCECRTLDNAVAKAAAAAGAGEVVMLSPACASFDQYSDFEARGAAFRAAVGGI